MIKALDRSGNKILPEDKAAELYEKMKQNYAWWKDSHSFAPGRISYSYPAECGFSGSSYAELEFPLEAPDLYAQMILYAEVIGRVERLAGKGNGLSWYMESQALKKTLTEELWDGEKFVCRGVTSGKNSPAPACLPMCRLYSEGDFRKISRTNLLRRSAVKKSFLSPRPRFRKYDKPVF